MDNTRNIIVLDGIIEVNANDSQSSSWFGIAIYELYTQRSG
jgi:hypothetical protein